MCNMTHSNVSDCTFEWPCVSRIWKTRSCHVFEWLVRDANHHVYESLVRMEWLRLVGSSKLYVSFAKELYKRDDILQNKLIFLKSLLIVAAPCHAYLPSVVRLRVYTTHADNLQCDTEYTPNVLTLCSATEGIHYTCWRSAVRYRVYATRTDTL